MEVLRAFPIAEFTPSTRSTVAGLFWYPASGTMVSLKDLFKGIAQAIFFGGKYGKMRFKSKKLEVLP
jgi:hypothetical protein